MEIIYGSTSIPAGPEVFGGYLARPDAMGQWPTVIVFGPEPVPTSAVKNLCRVFARHAIAALAPDLTTDRDVNQMIAAKIVGFISDPSGRWSNAQLGYGILAFGHGIYDAAPHAAAGGAVAAVAGVATTFDEIVTESLRSVAGATLYIGSRGDEDFDPGATLDTHEVLPLATFVVYPDAPAGWWDDDADGYDDAYAADTFDRVISFFSDHLPARV